MRIIQLCHYFSPRASAANGGELRYWQNFAALAALGHEVHLVIFDYPAQRRGEVEPEVAAAAASVRYMQMASFVPTRREAWQLFVSKHSTYLQYFPQVHNKQEEMQRIIDEIKPDLIWVEVIGAMALEPKGCPVVYSHHDFHYKVLQMRDKIKGRKLRWIDQMRRSRLKVVELDLIKNAQAILCVSDSEREQVAEVVDLPTHYIPIVGKTIPRPTQKSDKPRFMLFGNLNNTSLRYSMNHFKRDILPRLDTETLAAEWHQVGASFRDDELTQWIQGFFQPHGFVEDLSQVFRIGDACFSPYPEDTGFRTRFVTAAGYGLVNIGYRETFMCAPEFTPGKDCIAAGSPDEMIALMREYATDAALRERMGMAARELYERAFSFESQLPKFARVVEDALANQQNKTGDWMKTNAAIKPKSDS